MSLEAERVSRFIKSVCLMLFGLLLDGCTGAQSVLNPVGPQSGRISRLWWLMFYVCSAVFLLVSAAVLVAIFRRRSERERTTNAPDTLPDAGREERMTRVIVGAVAVTAVVLFVFLIASFTTGRGLYSLPSQQALIIKVTGHQWWWDVEYEDPLPSNIVYTANEIHVPVGRPVLFRLMSDDVIHSFWAPNLSGKTDLIPGHQMVLTFQADQPGEYRGQCAEFCGFQHAHMAFTIIAETPEQFYKWMSQQRAPAVAPADATQLRGQQVFLSSPCIMCHTIRGTDAGGHVAPDLTHLASRKTIAAGTLPNTRGHLGGWITNSQEIKPGNHMPPVPLKSEDLQALLAYLESLK